MDENRLRGLLGLCVRAGQAAFGETGCRKALEGGTARLLLLDERAAENNRKRYESLCRRSDVTMRLLPAGLLEEATGRDAIAMVLRGGSLADQVIGCLNADGR